MYHYILALDFPPRFVKEMFKISVIQIAHVHLISFVASISHIPTHEGASSLKLCSIPFQEIDLVVNCISRFFHHTRYEPVCLWHGSCLFDVCLLNPPKLPCCTISTNLLMNKFIILLFGQQTRLSRSLSRPRNSHVNRRKIKNWNYPPLPLWKK